ncbi:hypothetical protein D6779_04560 [Candidatus Parcubacteria bacterium]|nr:MAG: hypothetical protein D6779_04560 [Candidatus Parcubacteria bacterium]
MAAERKSPKNLILAASVSLALLSASGVHGDVPSELQDAWQNGWIAGANVTSPGAYASASRGVLYGGNITVKSRIVNPNLVAFTPPSFNAGCNGISIFGGSFSFINADQLIALFKAVASNAAGYAFQLALSNACQDCAAWIETLQKKIMKLNSMFRNSCQLAKGLVTNAPGTMKRKFDEMMSIFSMTEGSEKDAAESFSNPDPIGTAKSDIPGRYKKMTGNITYKAMLRRGFGAGRVFLGGDREFLETMMAFTGYVIVKDAVNDPNVSDAGKTNPIEAAPGGLNTLKTLIEGGDLHRYQCDTIDQCGSPSDVKFHYDGLASKVRESLYSIVEKFSTNSGTLTAREKAVLLSMPRGTGAMLRSLALASKGAGYDFATRVSGPIAFEIAYRMVHDSFNVMLAAAKNNDFAQNKMVVDDITKAKDTVERERIALAEEYSLQGIGREFKDALSMARRTELNIASRLLAASSHMNQ